MNKFILLSLVSSIVSALPQAANSSPSVTIQNGTIVGTSDGAVDTFNGIPFAKPPLGPLRLKPPQTIDKPFGTIQSVDSPASCPQFFFQVNMTKFVGLNGVDTSQVGATIDSAVGQQVLGSSEDCLTLNVQRPKTANANSKLPVLFFIFGGGFEFGSTNMFDATPIINRSVQMGKPILYVAVNYRTGGFGFMPGKQLSAEGSTNLGLRDQLKGLQWIQENIAAFGGDPDKVTIWGESAGAISVFSQILANGGDNTFNGKPLFRAAIMDSGTVVPVDPVTAPQAQRVFDTVVKNGGCSNAANPLDCLRGLDTQTFLDASNSVPGIIGFRSVDLSYLPRPDPTDSFFPQSGEQLVMQNKFAKVPMIIGDQEDEGTLFALFQSNLTTNRQVSDYLKTFFPNIQNPALIDQLLALYPDDRGVSGSPFSSGPENNFYPQFKRLAAVLGDITFTQIRRVVLSRLAPMVRSFSYLATYNRGLPILGTMHASDLLVVYDMAGLNNTNTVSMQSYFISFTNELDPNALGTSAPLIKWPQYDANNPQLLNFRSDDNAITADNFRKNVSDFLTVNMNQIKA